MIIRSATWIVLSPGHRCSCTKVKLRHGCHNLMLPRIACQESWGGSSVLVQSSLLVDAYPLERSRILFSVSSSESRCLINSSWLTDHSIKGLLALHLVNYSGSWGTVRFRYHSTGVFGTTNSMADCLRRHIVHTRCILYHKLRRLSRAPPTTLHPFTSEFRRCTWTG
jgi:hypothetical protein